MWGMTTEPLLCFLCFKTHWLIFYILSVVYIFFLSRILSFNSLYNTNVFFFSISDSEWSDAELRPWRAQKVLFNYVSQTVEQCSKYETQYWITLSIKWVTVAFINLKTTETEPEYTALVLARVHLQGISDQFSWTIVIKKNRNRQNICTVLDNIYILLFFYLVSVTDLCNHHFA